MRNPGNHARIARELGNQVSLWLTQEGAEFLQEPRLGDRQARVDFLVLRPLQFAVETVALQGPSAALMRKAKRLLTQRINLADQFGAALPLVLVVPSDEDLGPVPFVDSVLSAEDLPPLPKLKSQLSLDRATQEILRGGDPGQTELTDPDSFVRGWSEALSLEEIAEGRNFQAGTIAADLSGLLAAGSSERTAAPISDVVVRGWEREVLSVRFHHAFQKILETQLANRVSGRKVVLQVKSASLRMTYDAWETGKGRRCVVRRWMLGPNVLDHKAAEFKADAWILRAIHQVQNEQLVLVLGSKEPITKRIIAGARPDLGWLRVINEFEAAGWRVFPWDFGQPVPRFIEYVGQLGR